MEDNVRNTLDERIQELLDKLGEVDASSEKYSEITENLHTLYNLRIDEKRLENDRDAMLEDVSLRVHEQQIDRNRNKIEIGKSIFGNLCGLIVAHAITKKEETEAVTSKALNMITSFFKFKS